MIELTYRKPIRDMKKWLIVGHAPDECGYYYLTEKGGWSLFRNEARLFPTYRQAVGVGELTYSPIEFDFRQVIKCCYTNLLIL